MKSANQSSVTSVHEDNPRKGHLPMAHAYTSETPSGPLSPAKRMAAVAAAKGGRKPGPAKAVPEKAQVAASALVSDGQNVLSDPRLPGVEISLEFVTPDLAEHYLSKLPTEKSEIQQRHLSQKLVDRYALDMTSEQWPFAGDPVRFNIDGELIDGQHRLRGIVQSKVSQMMIVIRGLERETFAVFDTGRARSFPDILKSKGVANVSMNANITRRVLQWRRGNYGVPNVPRVLSPKFLGVSASPGYLLETFNDLATPIQNAARRGNSYKSMANPKTAAPGVIGFMYLLFSSIDLERAELFFHELQFGPRQAGPEYPIFVLRERMKERIAQGQSGSPDWVWMHFFITTWNAWFEGKSMKSLRTPPVAAISHLALPVDPHASERPVGWTPLGGVVA